MNDIRIAFMGDIMPGGLLDNSLGGIIDHKIHEYLQNFDIRAGTLECAVGDNFEYYHNRLNDQGKNKNIIFAKSEHLSIVESLKINLLSIANNHIFDLGEEGLNNTIAELDKRNIKYCGAGSDLNEASLPAVFEINGRRLGFIGCAEIIPSSPNPATEKKAGFNPLFLKKILSDIKKLKKEFDYLFVLPHWGDEYTYFPPARCREAAFAMIKAGADGVIGGHPHVIQPQLFYKSKPIFFSLGNFLFPNRFVRPPATTFYPEKNNIPKNPPLSGSPYCSEVTLKTWISRARIGMIAGIYLSNIIRVDKIYTHLNTQNQLRRYTPPKTTKVMLYTGGIMSKYFHSSFLAGLRIIKWCRKTFNRLFRTTRRKTCRH